jgi:DNA-directed RNA polymerase specialized sigma24 family protein
MKRLVAQALRWFAQEGLKSQDDILSATGKSPTDLAYDVVLEVLRDEKVQWRPQKPDEDPYPFLVKVMRNDFLDLVRPGRAYKRTQVMDTQAEEDQPALDNYESSGDDLEKLHAALTAHDLHKMVGEEQDLKDMIDAILLLECRKREDIAHVLSTTPEEITRRQQRLRTKLASWRRTLAADAR